MASRLILWKRTLAIAVVGAVLAFGLAAYGVVGAPAAASAILETTSQSPLNLLPRPSFEHAAPPVGAGATTTQGAPGTEGEALVVGGILALIGGAVAVNWRRRRRAGA